MRASLFLSGTTEPAPFFADPDRKVSLGSVLGASAVGQFPQAFQNTATAFRLILENERGERTEIDPFYFQRTPYLGRCDNV